MDVKELSSALGVLGRPRELAAFVDLVKGKSPEDTYLKHVWCFHELVLAATPEAYKQNVRTTPDFETFFNTSMPALSSLIDIAKATFSNWPTFCSFYKPFVDAGLLTERYEVTNKSRELHKALDTLLQ